MNFCFYSKYNGKSTIEQLRRVELFCFPPRHFILSITHCRSFASNNSSSICSANHLYSGRATLLKSSSYSSYSLICSMFLLFEHEAANHYRLTALCLLFNYKCLSVSLAPYIKRRTSITSSITT